ncbi:DNA helicase [Betaproteobacteria bacterium]|nr:DNA helicase [Betaproteobacteria bacterium]GHT97309.1 DNA helicase [Betaproteobacteria bacterium]GHU27533.1 DNA helicase [Betaproteobacteria bacterium]
MAQIIPALDKHTLARMTAGEKRVAEALKKLLEDDYLVWYDIPVGRKRRYPDFIILHPSRGLLFLEVKDWNPETLKHLTSSEATLLTNHGQVTEAHPLEQARQYAYEVIRLLERDPQLCEQSGAHRGKLVMPYGWGVVLTNITRNQISKGMPDEIREKLLPDHLMIYKGEFTESIDPENFQQRLWNMFNYQFGQPLSLPQIDRIRWHLFPEIRIDVPEQNELFSTHPQTDEPIENALPDIIQIMDLEQEKIARSLGVGHRVIHGVAGSGKTMILGYRCQYLSKILQKPILVLCFNITLAAWLRTFISSKGIGAQVQIYHFHDWCVQQLKTYNVEPLSGAAPAYERQVSAVIEAVENGFIPRAQYGAILIDEGHDMQPEWLKLVVQMLPGSGPESDALLLLYDDAQSIYKKKSGLGFTLSSVGIRASGRTRILRINYRNTREILDFAYGFAHHYLTPHQSDDDHIPVLEPESVGNHGVAPVVRKFGSFEEELDFILVCIRKWHADGVRLASIAVLCPHKYQGEKISQLLKKANIPHQWLASRGQKLAFDSKADALALTTIHSSKGLEFERVIIVGIGQMKDDDAQRQQSARLLYVGMTRAQKYLLITSSGENEFSKRIEEESVRLQRRAVDNASNA